MLFENAKYTINTVCALLYSCFIEDKQTEWRFNAEMPCE